MTFYRYEMVIMKGSSTIIELVQYEVIAKKKHGYQLRTSKFESDPVYMSLDGIDQVIYSSKKKALNAFIKEKEAELYRCQKELNKAQFALDQAENFKRELWEE